MSNRNNQSRATQGPKNNFNNLAPSRQILSVAANQKPELSETLVTRLDELPVTYQAISDFFSKFSNYNPFILRKETFNRIEKITGRPLITYVSRLTNVPERVSISIDDSDINGFADLIYNIPSGPIDVFLVSNGGVPTTAERIVRMLRGKFTSVRFIIPFNAFSAATLICFSGDEILMDSIATLGPIDPQVGGIPTRTILRAFEVLEERVKVEGPMVLATYAKLIEKYHLHDLEFCKTAEKLSEELAQTWLSQYMFNCLMDDAKVTNIVNFFTNFDIQKSHGRSIDRVKARELGLKVIDLEKDESLAALVRSLHNQYELWFNATNFYKMFENSRGVNWGRQAPSLNVQIPFIAPEMPQA